MKLGDIVSRVVIDTRKLTEYALNPDNPVGANKALMFQRHQKPRWKPCVFRPGRKTG